MIMVVEFSCFFLGNKLNKELVLDVDFIVERIGGLFRRNG